LTLQHVDDQFTHRAGLLAAGDVFGAGLKAGAALVEIGDDDLGFGQVELAAAGNVAEHDIEQPRRQQRDAKHEHHGKRAAEGTEHVLEGNVENFQSLGVNTHT